MIPTPTLYPVGRETQRAPLTYIPKRYIDPRDKTYILHMNSENGDFVDMSTATFTTSLSEQITAEDTEVIYLSVTNISIPYSFYSVSSLNNQVTITESNLDGTNQQVPFIIQIPEGNYIIDELVLYIQTQLNATTTNQTVYQVTYNQTTSKCTIATVTANRRTIFDFTGDNSCYHLFGFTYNIQAMTSTAPLISDSVVAMSDIYNLYLRLLSHTLYRGYDMVTRKPSNILCKIPVNVPAMSIIFMSDNDQYEIPIKEKVLNILSFQLTDEYQRPINMNSMPYTFDLIVNIVKKISA